MNKYSLSEAAIRDLDEISSYFARVSIEAGERFVKRFADKCRNLIKFPKMGRIYAEIMPNLPGVPLEGYIILLISFHLSKKQPTAIAPCAFGSALTEC